MNVISPRIFEAIALRTALVLFPGEYSGVIEAERHYIPLEKDFSNFDRVVATIRDDDRLMELTERAYLEIGSAEPVSYGRMISELDAVIDELGDKRSHGRLVRYRLARAEHPFGDRLPQGSQRHRLALSDIAKPVLRGSVFAGGGAAMVMSDAHLRPLAWRLLVRRGLWVGKGQRRLMQDLVRLAMVRRGHEGRLSAGRPFAVTTDFQRGTGELLIRSVPKGTEETPPFDLPGFVESARDGTIRRIAWDHTPVSHEFPVRLTKWGWIRFCNWF